MTRNRQLASTGKAYFHPTLVLLTCFILLFALSSCKKNESSGEESYSSRSGGTLNYFLGEPVSLDPAFSQDAKSQQVTKELFDGLIDYNPKTARAEPAVATKWKSNLAGDKWTFWLRRDVRFHNGRKVTASDFVYAWDRVAAKKTASKSAYHLAPIKGFIAVRKGKRSHLSGVKAVGKHKLEVTLKYPFSDFPLVLGQPVFSPVPKEEVKKGGRLFADKPVGNGPFVMDGSWEHQKSLKLKKFKRYYGKKAYLDGVDFKTSDNEQTAFLQFQGGGLDVSPIPSGQVKATETQFGADALVGQPQLVLRYYGFNLRKRIFKKNIKLRQAINYAVDRKAIVSDVYNNVYVAAGGIVPPVVVGYKKPSRAYSYSASKAKRLLKQAGYPGGKGLPTIKLIYNTSGENEDSALIMQQNLRDIGITVALKGLGTGAFKKALRDGKMSMFADEWQADYPSSDAFLYQLFYSKSKDNFSGFSDPKVDRLLTKVRKTVAVAPRKKLYNKVENEVLKQAPIVPYVFIGTRVVHARKVEGFERTALGYTPLDRVWISNN